MTLPATGDRSASLSMNWTRALFAAALLGLFWVALPARLPGPSAGPLNEQCLTVSDKPQDSRSPGPENAGTHQPATLGVLERCSAVYPNDVELMADLGVRRNASGIGNYAEWAHSDSTGTEKILLVTGGQTNINTCGEAEVFSMITMKM